MTPEAQALPPIERIKLEYRDGLRQIAITLSAEIAARHFDIPLSLDFFDLLMRGFEKRVSAYGREMYDLGHRDGRNSAIDEYEHGAHWR